MITLNDRIRQKLDQIKAIADEFPGVVIVHYLENGKVLYMSQAGVDQLCTPLEEITAMTPEEYYTRFFNAEEAKEYTPKMLDMVMRNDPGEVYTFFQQVRIGEERGFKWHLSSMRILMHDDDGRPMLSLLVSQSIDPLYHLTNKVSRLLEENTFLRKNYTRFSSLGNREKEVLALLSKGKSSSDIADELHLSVTTVETHRRNIKRKLEVTTHFELTQYALAFDLV